MADPIIINERRVHAQQRLYAGCATLAKLAGVEPPQKPPLLIQDPQFRSMQDLESMADFVETLNAALGPKEAEKQSDEPPTPKSGPKSSAKK